jgi:hypothetical protein
MARKRKKQTPKTFVAGRTVFVVISIAVAAAGTVGWLRGEGDLAQRLPFAFLAAAAGFVIPIRAGQIARRSWAMILPALLFAAWSAYSIEHANEVLVEGPRKAAHEHSQQAAIASVRKAEALLTTLQDRRANFVEEKVDCDPCRKTKQDAAARDKDRRAELDRNILIAEADLDKKKLMVAAYAPLIDWRYVLAFGALVDLVIAVAIYCLEASAQREAQKHEADKKRNRRNAKRDNLPKVIRALKVTDREQQFLLQTRGPRLATRDGVGV